MKTTIAIADTNLYSEDFPSKRAVCGNPPSKYQAGILDHWTINLAIDVGSFLMLRCYEVDCLLLIVLVCMNSDLYAYS